MSETSDFTKPKIQCQVNFCTNRFFPVEFPFWLVRKIQSSINFIYLKFYMSNKFEIFLNQFDEKAWLDAVAALLPEIHEVDRNAVQIWFRFYPLSLFRYLQNAENKEEAVQKFVLQGDYELKNQIDSSHKFLYGHRFWKETHAAIVHHAKNFHTENADLKTEARAITKTVAQSAKTTECLAVGIVLAGLMTIVQAGKNPPKKF